jgi:regulator of replication initiation timing
LGKTETIKERAIYVYLPSADQKERWENCARAQGTSISKFVIEHVEDSLRQDEDRSYQSRSELWRTIQELKEQLEKVSREKHVLEIAAERLEEELGRYRSQPFLEETFVGVRRYQKELVEILKEGRVVSDDEILSRLRIKPSEQEAVKAVSKQLENLESYGFVQSSPRGWKWVA